MWRAGNARSLGTTSRRGAKHYRDLVYVDRIEFLDSKGGNGNSKTPESASDETTVTDEDVLL